GAPPGSQGRLLRRERVTDLDGVGGVRRPEWDGARLQHPGADQLLAHARTRAQRRRVGDRAGPVGAQLVWERVITAQPGHLFDQVRLARDVRPPTGHLHREPFVFGRGNEADRRQQALDVAARDVDAEEVIDARWA